MVLTRDFKETIQARVARDPAFREALLKEGIEVMLSGDIAPAKPFCVTISTPQSALRPFQRKPGFHPRASCACLGLKVTPMPVTCLRCSATSNSARRSASRSARAANFAHLYCLCLLCRLQPIFS